jgi:hypothetical protein
MTANPKVISYLPVLITAAVHLIIIGIAYGTVKSEMKSFNDLLGDVVVELKKTNESIQKMQQTDIKLIMNQEYINQRIDKLETKHP